MDVKILVVDDSATDRKIISAMLAGYHVLLAGNGLEALKVLEENPDTGLMILDLNMPEMNGFQVLELLKTENRFPKLRTIILTNYDELENEIRGLQLGAVDYIRKPVHMDSLKVRIRIHIELMKVERLLEDRLLENELTLDTVLLQAPIGIAISRGNTPYGGDSHSFVSMNPMFEEITGRNREELNHLGWAKITHPGDLQTDLENFRKLENGETRTYSVEKRLIRPDGSLVWVNVVVASLLEAGQTRYGYICLLQDISRRKKAEQSLAESERSKSVLLSNLRGMAYRCSFDRNWTMQFVSSGCEELTGYSPENLLYNRDISFDELISPEYRKPLWEEWKRITSLKLPFRYEYEIITAQGTRKWVLEIGQGVYDDQGEVDALEGIIIDITDRKDMENALRHNSEHDELTGLYNHRYLESALRRDLESSVTENRALVSVNLSAVSSLSITQGLRYRQNLIRRIAGELNPLCCDRCMLCNTYEYRFVFYLRGYRDRQTLSEFCETVSDTLNALLTVERISVGIGVLEIGENTGYDPEHLLKNLLVTSEEALKAGDGENGILYYDREMEKTIIRQELLQRELAELSGGEHPERLLLHYQPILDLRSNRICGFEALARYMSPRLGLVPPLEFIPLAEESKYIISIGDMIIEKACRFIGRLKDTGYEGLQVAVNISAIQLLNRGFVEHLLETIRRMGTEPEALVLELTESVFASRYDRINGILLELKEYGIHCSLDDFGTGYSSLSRERELKVNCLKIDKSFINKLMYLSREETITGDIISMAHRLNHCVVAEGVEHEEQLEYLRYHGCDRVQGYLICRPLPDVEALKFLSKHNGRPDG